MLDKRAFLRDQRLANIGLLRRIRLRIRPTPAKPQYSSDPTIDTQQNYNPSSDTFHYITGVFRHNKNRQYEDDVGLDNEETGTVWFHPIYESLVRQAYSMYIGGTHKEWEKCSVPFKDESRAMLQVSVEAVQ